MPIGTPQNIDNLISQIDDVVTIGGQPHKIIGEEDNELRQNLIQSFHPQTMRYEQDGINSPTIDFLSKECFFFNTASGDYKLEGITNALIGREIKIVVYGANRFLIDSAFTNVRQIGTHIKGQYNICYIMCVPDEYGQSSFLFNWQNESVTNYQSDGTSTFTENTNEFIEQTETSTDGTLLTKLTKRLYKIGNGFISIATHTLDFATLFLNVNGDSGISIQRFDGTDYATITNRISSDLSVAQGVWQNKLSNLFDIYVGTFVRTRLVNSSGSKIESTVNNISSPSINTVNHKLTESNLGNTVESAVDSTGKSFVKITSKYGESLSQPYLSFDINGVYESKLKFARGDIGEWDMDILGEITITLPSVFIFLDTQSIESLSATIITDPDSGQNTVYSIFRAGHIDFIDNSPTSKQLKISRYSGDFFDGTFFNQTGFNRGYWTMTYRG